MVPGHPFNEMKPNSGRAKGNPAVPSQKVNCVQSHAEISKSLPIQRRAQYRSELLSRRRFVIEQMREPLPHVARLVEMTGDAVRAPADRKRKAAEIGHDGKHRFRR